MGLCHKFRGYVTESLSFNVEKSLKGFHWESDIIKIINLSPGWSRMTMIPHDAHQLSVHIATPVPLNIALRERRKDKQVLELRRHSKPYDIKQDKYLKYDPNVPQNLQIIEVDSNVIDIKEGSGSEGSVVAAGTLLRWTQTDTDVFISSESRLQTDLMILVSLPIALVFKTLLQKVLVTNFDGEVTVAFLD